MSGSDSGGISGPGALTSWTGRRMGPYTLVHELGRGSHGVVFLARRDELGREFALKVLAGEAARDPEVLRRFRLEAAVAGRLDDPGIVRVLDVGETEGRPWLVMDHCPGPTLRQRLQHQGPYAPRAAAELLRDLARAVAAAHAQGVVHRDLKPANVILDARSGGRPRVTDFGLAMDRSLVKSMTQSGDIIGTPYYMSPEQLHSARVDARSDVWGLGVILYECLSGQRPFEGRTPLELARAVSNAPIRPVRDLAPEVPRSLEAVCLRALARDPAARYRDARELAVALDEVLALLPGAEETEARVGPPWPRWGSGGARPSEALVAAGALLLVGVGVAVGLLAGRGLSSPSPTPIPIPIPSPPTPEPAPTPGPLRARPGEIELLERSLGGRRPRDSERARLEELRAAGDPEARYLVAMMRIIQPGEEHQNRREMVRAARAGRIYAGALDRIGRLSWALGFERAASWVAEQSWERGGAPEPRDGAFLVQLYLKADPPVWDPARGGELAGRLLAKKTPATAREYPETWMLHGHRADAAIGLGRLADAKEACARAEAAPGGAEGMGGLGELMRRSGLPPKEACGKYVRLDFGATQLLSALGELDAELDRDPATAVRAFLGLAGQLEQARECENAVTALLRAAKAERRARPGPDGATAALPHIRRALAIELGMEATDTSALLHRTLARTLLEARDPDPAGAARAAEEALSGGPPGWEEARTPAEQADALVLLARARLLSGDRTAARRALSEAEALAPVDRRELEALALELR